MAIKASLIFGGVSIVLTFGSLSYITYSISKQFLTYPSFWKKIEFHTFFYNVFMVLIGGKKIGQFNLEFLEKEGWSVDRFAEVTGVFSHGETLGDLKENIRGVYRTMLESEPVRSEMGLFF
jgi:predicted RNase H-like HicB family nuclease